jgi:hypothetical protein
VHDGALECLLALELDDAPARLLAGANNERLEMGKKGGERERGKIETERCVGPQPAAKPAATWIIAGYLGGVGDGPRRARRFDGPDLGTVVEAGARHLEKERKWRAAEMHGILRQGCAVCNWIAVAAYRCVGANIEKLGVGTLVCSHVVL